MNLLADEGVDRAVVDRHRQEGHDVVYIAELSPSVTDEEVLRQANNRGALLVTADKDFGELVFRMGRLHGGAGSPPPRWPTSLLEGGNCRRGIAGSRRTVTWSV